ncbi:hypothetical protein P886_0854 [Alteromonadaceae bacterium 2753L.S.0a.02]|nr:hypothetical protein P886_0854 [Alteromonadaceae bacterium 2753L.S.0a.02]
MDTLHVILILIIIAAFFWIFLLSKKKKIDSTKGEDVSTQMEKFPEAKAYPGTDTVFVGVYVDESGNVATTSNGELALPGQKVIYSSSYEFEIRFKNDKSPVGKIDICSGDDGIALLKIPKDILSREEYVDEYEKNGEVVFNYDIKVGNLTLDPPLRIKEK